MRRTLLRRQSLWIIALALLLLAIFTVGVHSTRVADPEYKGRHLSEWMNMVRDDPSLSAHDPRSQEAIRILREMGTNAVPSLLAWMQYEPVAIRYHLAPLYRHLPRFVVSALPHRWLFGDEERKRYANKAVNTFALLGPAAAPIPELVRLAGTPWQNAYTSDRAVSALATLGPPAIPFFQRQLSNPETASPESWYAIQFLGTNARPLVPLLIKTLQHTNRVIFQRSCRALAALKLEPELVVPALTDKLNDPVATIRWQAAFALQKLGSSAELALPTLTNRLNDPDLYVQERAAEAIQSITRALLSANTPDIPPELPTSALSH